MNQMNEVIATASGLPLSREMNRTVTERVVSKMPELSGKIAFFDRANSQIMTSMMTLTMLNGQSPMRLLRQVLAEVNSRKLALAEAQLSHAKALRDIRELEQKPDDGIRDAELLLKRTTLEQLEININGAMKEIACLIDAYEHIKSKHGVGDDWTEMAFEDSEKLFHVRRAFELLYRNILQTGTPHEATMEYLQQFGVHIQVASAEVAGYIAYTQGEMLKGDYPSGGHLENFLDDMARKYRHCADEACERMFGTKDILNPEYVTRVAR
jgi:hypothetical protein